jgi:hypothetical protein
LSFSSSFFSLWDEEEKVRQSVDFTEDNASSRQILE